MRSSWRENETENVERFLIVGLGNPGRRYQGNRHNVGFMVIDRLAEQFSIPLTKVQAKAIIGVGQIMQTPVILAKPQTYMNESGRAVGPLARYYRIPLTNLLVIYDEIDLPFGALRLREKGGAGGHNGMRSIIADLGQEFARLRLGVGRPPAKMEPAAYVLQDFGKDERPIADELIDTASQAVCAFLQEGIDLAMTRFNGQTIDP